MKLDVKCEMGISISCEEYLGHQLVTFRSVTE